jgi:3-hydroxymyristoyl/3-hydroxydecanoyl-(acyl carrier protein) dehydratase
VQAEELEPLIRRLRRSRLVESPTAERAIRCERSDIERVLPHRDPFLLLDSLTGIALDARRLTGERRVAPDDPVFRGHFPGEPVYPGVLQIEMIGQLGLCLMHFVLTGEATIPADAKPPMVRALKVHHALFAAPIAPGDLLTLHAELVDHDEMTGTLAGQVFRGDELCSMGIVEVYFGEN